LHCRYDFVNTNLISSHSNEQQSKFNTGFSKKDSGVAKLNTYLLSLLAHDHKAQESAKSNIIRHLLSQHLNKNRFASPKMSFMSVQNNRDLPLKRNCVQKMI